MTQHDPHPEVRSSETTTAECKAAVQQAPTREMPCPVCDTPMPDLKGGKASICPVCGFKDSCCY